MGTYAGVGPDVYGSLSMDRMLGRRLPIGLTFLDSASWAGMSSLSSIQVRVGSHVGIRDQVIVSIPMPSGTLEDIATGVRDDYYIEAAENIRDCGFPTAIIRPLWEFNGSWFLWKAAQSSFYIAAYERICSVMRVSGSNYKMCWSPDNLIAEYMSVPEEGYYFSNPFDNYPSDEYVDYIGLSCYNRWFNGVNSNNPQNRWANELLGKLGDGWDGAGTPRPYGLAYWADFAATRGKQLILAEYGTGYHTTSNGLNCGDDEYYIEKIIEFANTYAYAHVYFDRLDSFGFNVKLSYSSNVLGYDSGVASNNKPNASTKMISLLA